MLRNLHLIPGVRHSAREPVQPGRPARGGRAMRSAALLLSATLLAPLPAAAAAPTTDTTRVEFLNSGKVVPPSLPFSEAVRVGETLYLSGQIGIRPGTLQLVPGGLAAESRQAMDNIRTTLAAHGFAMGDLVKCTVMLADMARWAEFNAVYRDYFAAGRYPARSALGANGLGTGGAGGGRMHRRGRCR